MWKFFHWMLGRPKKAAIHRKQPGKKPAQT
jgi:hypothetical protein